MNIALHNYQREAIKYLAEPGGACRLLVMVTGGGKTEIIKAAVAWVREEGSLGPVPFRGALIVAPLTTIEDSFATEVVYDYGGGCQRVFDSEGWVRPREAGSKAAVDALFSGEGKIVLTTHATLRRWFRKGWITPGSLAGYLLVVDEVHHSGAGKTYVFDAIRRWLELDGVVWGATATIFRTDELKSLPPGALTSPPFVRSWVDLVRLGLGIPGEVDFSLRELGHPVPVGKLSDEDVETICRYLIETDPAPDGRPMPSVLALRPGITEDGAERLACRFEACLQRLGSRAGIEIRLVQSVGEKASAETRRRLIEDREAVRAGGFVARTIDIVISCGRMREGADWPSCCRIVAVGASTALLLMVQLAGRAMRAKGGILGFPAAWASKVQLVVFAPELRRLGPEGEYTEIEHASAMLLLACYFASAECTHDFSEHWPKLMASFRAPPGADREKIVNVVADVFDRHTPQEQAAMLRDLLVAGYGAIGDAPDAIKELTVGKLVRHVERCGGDRMEKLISAIIGTAGGAALHREELEAYRRALAAVEDEIERSRDTRPEAIRALCKEARTRELRAVAEKWSHLVVPIYDKVLGKIGLTASVMARQVPKMVADMRRARDRGRELDWLDIDYVLKRFREDHGVPVDKRGAATDLSKYVDGRFTVADLAADLKRVHGVSLSVAAAYSELGMIDGTNITEADLEHAASVRIPLGLLTDAVGATTRAALLKAHLDPRLSPRGVRLLPLGLACHYGWRGMPGGQSLTDAVEQLRAAAK